MICEYAINHKTPVVIATTGFNPEQKKQIKELSKIVPVLKVQTLVLALSL